MDVIVFGRTTEQHDKRLKPTHECLFRQSKFKFLRHIVDKDGISAELEK